LRSCSRISSTAAKLLGRVVDRVQIATRQLGFIMEMGARRRELLVGWPNGRLGAQGGTAGTGAGRRRKAPR
jgi:hypothetical protein